MSMASRAGHRYIKAERRRIVKKIAIFAFIRGQCFWLRASKTVGIPRFARDFRKSYARDFKTRLTRLLKLTHVRSSKNNPADRAGQSRGLSKQAESGGAGHGAWEISPAT